jgi:hypothetical protein
MSTRRRRPVAGAVLADARGDGRALRVTWHAEAGVVVISLWRDNVCTATAQLGPADAAELVRTLTAGLPRDETSAGATPTRAEGA